MMTVAPPVVHPSLGLIALMHGVAAYPRQREEQIQHLGFDSGAPCLLHIDTLLHPLCFAEALNVFLSQRHIMKIASRKKMMDLSFKA